MTLWHHVAWQPANLWHKHPVAILFLSHSPSWDIIFNPCCSLLEIQTIGLEFASAESYYQKVIGTANNYSYYASKCIGEMPVSCSNSL